MKKVLFFMFFIALNCFASSAFADNKGRYYCERGTCSFTTEIGGVADGGELADIRNFISTTVNVDVSIWRPGDTVTVCDGNSCISVKYTSTGAFVPNGKVQSDSGAKYKNHAALSSWGGSGGGGDTSVTRYVERPGTVNYICTYIDYYSNGSYSFTSFAGCTQAP